MELGFPGSLGSAVQARKVDDTPRSPIPPDAVCCPANIASGQLGQSLSIKAHNQQQRPLQHNHKT